MAESPTSDFVAAVLCGGRSRRMGRDKALLPLDGVAMARRVAEAAISAGASRVVAVGGDPDALGALGLAVVPDEHRGDGPLPATITALRWAASAHPDVEAVFVAACDLVAPEASTIAATVAALGPRPGAVAAVPVHAGHRQWTHAAWRPRAVSALEDARRRGVRSLKRAAAELMAFEIEGLPGEHLADADTPEDLPRP